MHFTGQTVKYSKYFQIFTRLDGLQLIYIVKFHNHVYNENLIISSNANNTFKMHHHVIIVLLSRKTEMIQKGLLSPEDHLFSLSGFV